MIESTRVLRAGKRFQMRAHFGPLCVKRLALSVLLLRLRLA